MTVGAQSCECAASGRPSPDTDPLHGMIQHSFALQISENARPFAGWDNSKRVAERFDCGSFHARPVSEDPPTTQAGHSPLAQQGLTTLESLKPVFIRPEPPLVELPGAFNWAKPNGCTCCDRYENPSLVFADKYDDERYSSINDFLVSKEPCPTKRDQISQTLLELLAHKRSRLFGFRLANRFVNVLLPHALLCPSGSTSLGAWFVQPLVSFVRGGRDRSRLRRTYSLTFFLIPVKGSDDLGERRMPVSEIEQIVNLGWGFAAAPAKEPAKFRVCGELFDYLPAVARWEQLGFDPCYAGSDLPLREIIERVAFGVGLTLAQGKTGRADLTTARLIGNDAVMSLGSGRVSSVVVVDSLDKPEGERSTSEPALPEPLFSLMKALSDPIRVPQPDDPKARKYRLDRSFVDDEIYTTGVLPTKRCLVAVSDTQCGVRESALMQAGSTAYMTIGSATAIGMMRAIDRRLEQLDGAGPRGIAEIDREIAADLSEIYDLDITRESYREAYRRLRDRLGITRDYETLQAKMGALHRATSTQHEVKAQARLVWLTAAIVFLSVLIFVGTIVLVGKPGG